LLPLLAPRGLLFPTAPTGESEEDAEALADAWTVAAEPVTTKVVPVTAVATEAELSPEAEAEADAEAEAEDAVEEAEARRLAGIQLVFEPCATVIVPDQASLSFASTKEASN